ncbi:hypothetical protein [Streptomyces sp. NPDC088785]|uniref:hypothetical protein n=1 Tax=Streptomyces sp. NPDC088785 TaxID=3365897 RepID=UPI0037FB9FC4
MSRTPPGGTRALALVAAALLLLSACSEGDEKTTVTRERVVGDWTAPGGEKLALGADRSFTATGLDAGPLAGKRCPGGKVSGRWKFFADLGDGMYGTSERATSGDRIGLSFRGLAQEDCAVDLAVVDRGRTLCATDDPDVACGLDVRFTRRT